MNWDSIDGRHTGTVVAVLADGWLSLPLNNHAVMVQRPEGLSIIEDDEVAGWAVTCSCHWQGERWTRHYAPGKTDLTRLQVSLRRGWPAIPPVVATEAMHAGWQAHAAREVALTELEAARRAHEATAQRLANAAAAARAAALTWAEIGQAAGISRQAAHERWRGATAQPDSA